MGVHCISILISKSSVSREIMQCLQSCWTLVNFEISITVHKTNEMRYHYDVEGRELGNCGHDLQAIQQTLNVGQGLLPSPYHRVARKSGR